MKHCGVHKRRLTAPSDLLLSIFEPNYLGQVRSRPQISIAQKV